MSHSALNSFDDFYQLLADSLAKNSLIKLLLSKYRGADKSLQRITIRPISLQNEPMLSFVYQHQTNHITKNLSYDEGLASIKLLLCSDFKSAHLATAEAEVQLEISKKGKVQISTHNVKQAVAAPLEHDREKKRFVDI